MESRRNSTRRVSFAVTAHVRLFEKEEQVENSEEQELQKTLEMFHPENKKYFRDLTSLFDLSLESQSSYDVSLTGSPNMFREKMKAMNNTNSPQQTTPRSKLSVFSSATPILDSCISLSKRNTPTPVKNLVLELNPSGDDKQDLERESEILLDNDQKEQESMDMMSPIAQRRDSSMFMEMESPSYPKFSSRNSLSGIAPYLKSTPRSATSLRHTFFPENNSPGVGQSPLSKVNIKQSPLSNDKQSPSLGIKDSIADFFDLESPPSLKPLQDLVEKQKVRNSIAPFFNKLEGIDSDNDTDATIGRRIEQENMNLNQMVQAKKDNDFKKPRASIAPFFNGLDGCDSAEESFELDCSDSILNSTPKSSTPKKSAMKNQSTRNSIAPFFQGMDDNTSTENSFAEETDSHPESLDIEDGMAELQAEMNSKPVQTFAEKRKARTSIAHFFAEESEGESMVLDESRDLTNHAEFVEQDSMSNQNYFSTQESVTPRSTQESDCNSQQVLGRSSSGESTESKATVESSNDSSELDINSLIEMDELSATPMKAGFALLQESASPAQFKEENDGDVSITPRKRPTRAASSPKSTTRKATPRKLLSKTPDLTKSAVTPMRRALAQKVLATSVAEKEDDAAPKVLPAKVASPKRSVATPKTSMSKPASPKVTSAKKVEKQVKSEPNSPRRSKRSTLSFLESPIKKTKLGDIVLESNVVAKQQVTVQPMEQESPIPEKQNSQVEEQSDVDLMDETFMSIMDTSIVHEKSQDENNNTQDDFEELMLPNVIEIKDLNAFLDATGINFKPVFEFSEATRQIPADTNNIYDRMTLEIDNIYGEYYQHVSIILIFRVVLSFLPF